MGKLIRKYFQLGQRTVTILLVSLAALMVGVLAGCDYVNPKGELQRMGIPYTPAGFVLAAQNGQLDAVRLFVRSDMPLDSRDNISATPLYRAAAYGHREVVDFLLAKGADVDAKNDSGFTPLIAAAASGHVEIVKLLASKGANVDAKNNDGFTAMHWAAANNQLDAIRTLLDLGANVNSARWANGGYPADEAIVRFHSEAAAMIIQRGGRYSR